MTAQVNYKQNKKSDYSCVLLTIKYRNGHIHDIKIYHCWGSPQSETRNVN